MARSPEAEFVHHTGLLADPAVIARELAASWLYLCDEELAAGNDMLRPNLVTCRAGMCSSALIATHEGVGPGVLAKQVLTRAASEVRAVRARAGCRDSVEQESARAV